MSVIGVGVNALDVGFLADVERKSLGKGSAVWHSPVRTDAAVGEGRLRWR